MKALKLRERVEKDMLIYTPGYDDSVYKGSRKLDRRELISNWGRALHVHRASSGIGRTLHARSAASEVERRYQT